MKHLRIFEIFTNIDSICKKYDITNYTINPDGSIDVDGHVDFSKKGLKSIPLKFGKVSGSFYCYNNNLTSLEGSPTHVSGSFNCYNNNLTSLEGGPDEMGDFNCDNNPITPLYKVFNDYKKFILSLDYLYLRPDMMIVKRYFKDACDEEGISIPNKINGYTYI